MENKKLLIALIGLDQSKDGFLMSGELSPKKYLYMKKALYEYFSEDISLIEKYQFAISEFQNKIKKSIEGKTAEEQRDFFSSEETQKSGEEFEQNLPEVNATEKFYTACIVCASALNEDEIFKYYNEEVVGRLKKAFFNYESSKSPHPCEDKPDEASDSVE